MQSSRTPDDCFFDLPHYPFAPHCAEVRRTFGNPAAVEG